MGQRIFLTGASGFLGRSLAKSLLAAGHEVLALHRESRLPSSLHCKELQEISGDLQKTEDLREAVEACDAIVHSAAYIPSRMAGAQ